MKNILEISNLEYYYQDGDAKRYIFQDLSYTFEKGTFYAILGESGSGKTTLLSILSGMDKQTNGVVKYEGKDIQQIGLNSYRRNNVGMVFQSFNLVPYMSAHQNLLTAMSITDNQISDQHNVAYNLLDFLGITKSKANRLVTKLSGGEQQRVAIARALATDVDIILADEPTGNLDTTTEESIINIFSVLAKKHEKCVIVVTHSKAIAKQADVVINLSSEG
ncbi:ABC transporter ATP-binding protein [Amedibacillus sp. YH-ame10]